jgi:hypothetical protein
MQWALSLFAMTAAVLSFRLIVAQIFFIPNTCTVFQDVNKTLRM